MDSQPSHHPDSLPRVSILVPNFNNGKASSRTGERDFISDLLKSLTRTLADDPTPFEIIACDDGSTDDSLDTLREWAANRSCPNDENQPFLRLIEMPEHTGVLSIVANRLYREARGDILVRLDGDIICLTPNWVSRLCDIFDHGPPRLGIVGPKQLAVNMLIHSLGDWILHPKGYHHHGFFLPRYQIRRTVEVDHVMGAFYCCRRAVWDDVGEFDENMLRGQTIDFGLRARLKGWSCWAAPDIEFVHAHSERDDRTTSADSRQGIKDSLRYFEDKWGFNRVSPDLDEVRARYAGTPLLWNARWFDGENARDPLAVWARSYPAPAGDLTMENTDWGAFATDERMRGRIMLRARAIIDMIRQTKMPNVIAHLCAGSGLIGHILSQHGLPYLGLDIHEAHVTFAREATAAQQYPNEVRPEFKQIADARRLPLDDHAVDMVALTDQMERHPNPTGLFKEIRRILTPGGFVIVISERRMPAESSAMQEEHWYLASELIAHIRAMGGYEVVSNLKQPHEHDIMVAARTGVSSNHEAASIGAGFASEPSLAAD